MARAINRLTVLQLAAKPPGRHCDGGGLYLHVQRDGRTGALRRSWAFRYRDRLTGSLREKGLGGLGVRSLAEAREAASKCRAQLRDGIDPIESQRAEREARVLEHARRLTFGQCVTRYIDAKGAAWRNAKHRAQWKSTLDEYAEKLTDIPVGRIDTALVRACLEPIWETKTETASRTRQRIEAVLDWAAAGGYRSGENPARWKGHLANLLASPAALKRSKSQPRAALPYSDMARFMGELRERGTLAAKALELQILTATRPGETAGAKWSEIDLNGKVWIIPGERMKAGKEHRIPLSAPAVALLKSIPEVGEFVFPGVEDAPMTTAAPMKLLKELRPGMTAHGFRSSFRDWAGEVTQHPREVIEHALSHQLKDKAEAAYARGTLMEKRARLMADWAKWCERAPRTTGGNVTSIKRGSAREAGRD